MACREAPRASYVVLFIEIQRGNIDIDRKGRMLEWLKTILVAQPMRDTAYGIIISPRRSDRPHHAHSGPCYHVPGQ